MFLNKVGHAYGLATTDHKPGTIPSVAIPSAVPNADEQKKVGEEFSPFLLFIFFYIFWVFLPNNVNTPQLLFLFSLISHFFFRDGKG